MSDEAKTKTITEGVAEQAICMTGAAPDSIGLAQAAELVGWRPRKKGHPDETAFAEYRGYLYRLDEESGFWNRCRDEWHDRLEETGGAA